MVAAECGTYRRTCPAGESAHGQAPAPAQRKFCRKWIKSRKQLTSQRPSSWCILLYSHPLALNFPAAALPCFSIRGRIRESLKVATFLPELSGFSSYSCPRPSHSASLGLPQPLLQGVELHLVPCNSPHGPVAEPQGIPLLAQRIPLCLSVPSPLLGFGELRK